MTHLREVGVGENANAGGDQLAEWLKEAGRRARREAPAGDDGDNTFNSPAELHRYLEQLAGRPLQSHGEVLQYLREVAGTSPRAHRDLERRRMVREVLLLVLVSLSYLHYYYWEVQVEIAKLNSLRIFIPTMAPDHHKST
jgi:hypothetical protein